MEEKDMVPSKVALLSVLSNTTLAILKLIAGVITGSLSVLSEAMDSAIDLLASLIAWFSLKKAEKPPDLEHPFGHGKWENIGGTIEAWFIFSGGILIVYHAIKRLLIGTHMVSIELGMGVMVVSIMTNLFLSRYVSRVALRYDSLVLEADAWHLRVNVYQSAAVLSGLILIRWTGLLFVDSIISLGLALFIIKTAYSIIKKSFSGLIDMRLPAEEEARIGEIIISHNREYGNLIGFHDLRTRKAGSERHIDLHLVVCKDERVKDIHDLCDHLEDDIKKAFPNSHVIIHVEPCEIEKDCPSDCYRLKDKDVSDKTPAFNTSVSEKTY